MILQEEFRSLVKAELEAQGISQRELARLMGMKSPTVNRYLNGVNAPGVDMVEKFFQALGIEVHLAVKRDDTKTPAARPARRLQSA